MTQTTNPQALTSTEFEQAVDQLDPKIAVFDCDGTLWADDSGSAFMRWSIQSGLLSREATDWIDQRYRRYLRGEVDELAICGEMVQVYQGLSVSELGRAVSDFFGKIIEPAIFPAMKRVVAKLHARGTEIWAVSSTNDWVVEEGVSRFGIPPERVLAARVAVVDGTVTNRIVDVPTDAGKVSALARAGVHAPGAVFGNSVHDAAMLAIAGRAFPVNPSPALAALSAERGWPVFYPTVSDK